MHDSAVSLLKQFCFDCHNAKKTKGEVNLEKMSVDPDFGRLFKTWDNVIAKLEKHEMPPEDEDQPTPAQRRILIDSIRHGLGEHISQHAGDPGKTVMRQLTSAEYAYTIQDLTGLELGLERTFVGDAVGGEGFSNVGDVQFIQDSTLERYLEAAKIVASHAVIGAGPLQFFADPGKTGQELSAIRRIQDIYRQHGFRTSAGEGGKAFGLERYPNAFFACWQFQHRAELGLAGRTLEQFASENGSDSTFVRHIWNVLTASAPSFPISEIAAAWRKLPAPGASASSEKVRAQCQQIYRILQEWQFALAENMGDAEVAVVLTESSFHPSLTNGFRIRLGWPKGITNASFNLAVASVIGSDSSKPVIHWKRPSLRFRQGPGGGGRGRGPATPLKKAVTVASSEKLRFGVGLPDRSIGDSDFITIGAMSIPIEFSIPEGATQAELVMETELDVVRGEDCVARCIVSHELNEGATIAAIGTFSVLLANPKGARTEQLKAAVGEFALKLPQISHREPAPADRDPIPFPFDNDYNNPERNDFHAFVKYHRDDRFLTEHILDSAARLELDRAWTDLLTAFDYHNTFLRFVAKKYRVDLADRTIATISPESVQKFPSEPRAVVSRLKNDYESAKGQIDSAQPGHVGQAVEFAQRAWRRPLSLAEKDKLRKFYTSIRAVEKLEHADAMRALLARILVAPAFIYHLEKPVAKSQGLPSDTPGWIALTDWELASRLSYFLWSSLPDQELVQAAASGRLREPAELQRQAHRMLHDSKARRFSAEFFGQWFGFYRFDDYRGVDPDRFPEFNARLKSEMYGEAVSFFDHIVRQDRPVEEMLFADYAFLNRNLASFYKVGAPNLSDQFTRVDRVQQYHRGGLLKLGAILTSTSAPLRTSAVKRGDWLLRRVLGTPVPPPPGDAGSIPPDDALADGKTVRQRLEAHRRDASCVNCHSRIDPLGFALEHFDSIGRWREKYRDGQEIDASGVLRNGVKISELAGLEAYLRSEQETIRRNLCSKLLGYGLGRGELVSDRPLVEQMMASLKKENCFSSLISQIVTSSQFRHVREGGEQKTAQVLPLVK